MNKKFKSTVHIVWCFLYLLVPFLDIAFGKPFDKFFYTKLIAFFCISLFFYFYNSRLIVEIKGKEIYFYEGVGITAPSSLEISRIMLVERLSKKMLKIKYDKDRVFSIESDRKVLDKIEEELKSLMK